MSYFDIEIFYSFQNIDLGLQVDHIIPKNSTIWGI